MRRVTLLLVLVILAGICLWNIESSRSALEDDALFLSKNQFIDSRDGFAPDPESYPLEGAFIHCASSSFDYVRNLKGFTIPAHSSDDFIRFDYGAKLEFREPFEETSDESGKADVLNFFREQFPEDHEYLSDPRRFVLYVPPPEPRDDYCRNSCVWLAHVKDSRRWYCRSRFGSPPFPSCDCLQDFPPHPGIFKRDASTNRRRFFPSH